MDALRFNELARRLVQEYGSSMTISRVTASTFSPTLGGFSSSTTTSFEAYGVIRTPQYRMWAGDRYYFGVLVESGDREVLFATPTTVTIEVGDLVGILGVQYRIVACLPVQPSGVTIIYKTLVRR